jgi:hypothetical protein
VVVIPILLDMAKPKWKMKIWDALNLIIPVVGNEDNDI